MRQLRSVEDHVCTQHDECLTKIFSAGRQLLRRRDELVRQPGKLLLRLIRLMIEKRRRPAGPEMLQPAFLSLMVAPAAPSVFAP
jgi:hypothetical protein